MEVNGASYIEKHRKIAEEYTKAFKADKRVEGICYLGSIARNYADMYSDIDIAIFSEERMLDLRLGEGRFKNFTVEVFNIAMNESYESWDETQKEAYNEGIIAYDKKGDVKRFLDNALKYTNEYKTCKIIEIFFKLGWHGWAYSAYRDKQERGYLWSLPPDLWIRRRRVENAFYIMNMCVDMLIDLIYAINEHWVPDIKWKWIKFSKLSWLPSSWENLSKLLVTENINKETFYEKKQIFQLLIDECYEKVVHTLPDDMYNYLIKINRAY